MKIGIIDADLIGRKKHYFPNLVCMKLSAWHKKKGDKVKFLTQYYHLTEYDRVYIAKVFTDTPVPDEVLKMSNVIYGGTGFFYDKAVPLMFEIEQIKPDYHLYDDYVKQKLSKGQSRDKYKYYLVMVTMETLPDSAPHIESIAEALECMEHVICKKIRSVDVCTRYSSMQYLIILFETEESKIKDIMERIFTQYRKEYKGTSLLPKYEYISMMKEEKKETQV